MTTPSDPAATDPRYPIGKHVRPPTITVEHLHAAQRVIAELPAALAAAVTGLDDAQLDTPYREGGWTVRQVVHHVADSHLHATARFRFALTEAEPTIKVYDEAAWAQLPDYSLPVETSLQLLGGLHRRWAALLDGLREEEWQRAYLHPENGRTTLADATLLYAWHSRHHTAHVLGLRQARGW